MRDPGLVQQSAGMYGQETIIPYNSLPGVGTVQNGGGFTNMTGINGFPVDSLVSVGNLGPGPIAYGAGGSPPRYLPGGGGLGAGGAGVGLTGGIGLPPGYVPFQQAGAGPRGFGMQSC